MANDLTDVLQDQLKQVAREFAGNLSNGSNGSEKARPKSRFPRTKGAIVGAGLALAVKKGIDTARQNPGLLDDMSGRINAKLEELQARDEEPEDDFEDEPQAEAEAPEPEAEEEPEAEAKPKPASKRKRSTTSRRSASKPKASKRASTSPRSKSKSKSTA